MATYALRGLDPDMVQAAKTRARDAGTSLDAVLRAYLTAYAEGVTPGQQLPSRGGEARRDAMTSEERSAGVRHAAQMQWKPQATE